MLAGAPAALGGTRNSAEGIKYAFLQFEYVHSLPACLLSSPQQLQGVHLRHCLVADAAHPSVSVLHRLWLNTVPHNISLATTHISGVSTRVSSDVQALLAHCLPPPPCPYPANVRPHFLIHFGLQPRAWQYMMWLLDADLSLPCDWPRLARQRLEQCDVATAGVITAADGLSLVLECVHIQIGRQYKNVREAA
jgi:hypothetical protein